MGLRRPPPGVSFRRIVSSVFEVFDYVFVFNVLISECQCVLSVQSDHCAVLVVIYIQYGRVCYLVACLACSGLGQRMGIVVVGCVNLI